jgi:hypothetical protein
MRPLAMMLVMTMTSVGLAQEPIAPQQADDPEVPRTVQLPAPPPPEPMLEAPPRAGTMWLPAPQGWRYHVTDGPPVQEKRWGLFTAGIVTFTVAWCANLQAGIPTGQWALDVPLFGPLIELANIGGAGSGPVGGWLTFMLVTDAAVQIGGFALMLAGATTYKQKPGVQRIELVPFGAGAAIRGSF